MTPTRDTTDHGSWGSSPRRSCAPRRPGAAPALWRLPRAHPERPATLALIALALLSTTAPYLLFVHLVAAVCPTKTSTVTHVLPLFGRAWGALFLGEPVNAECRSRAVALVTMEAPCS